MQSGHILAPGNCLIEKPPLAAASATLPFNALLDSALASAQIVNGVWNADSSQFEFYNNNFGVEIFGTFGRDNDGMYRLQIQTNPPLSLKDYVSYRYSPAHFDSLGIYHSGYYYFGNKRVDSHFGYALALAGGYCADEFYDDLDPVLPAVFWQQHEYDGHGRYRAGSSYNNSHLDPAVLEYTYNRCTEEGILLDSMIFDVASPDVHHIRTQVVSAFFDIGKFNVYGIFDFKNSFVTFAEGDSCSFSEIFSYWFEISGFNLNTILFNFANGSNIDMGWGQSGMREGADFNREIVSISLVCNPFRAVSI